MSRILIADDNAQNRYLLEFELKSAGHEVVAVDNGAEALAAARKSPPDLIITDVLMPGLDGFALCREWRADEALTAIPFVVYTATYTDPADETLALDLGADRFVVKPQEPAALLAIVDEVLASVRSGRVPLRQPKGPATARILEHNMALIRKLEKRNAELEMMTAKLRREVEDRRQADADLEEQIAELRRWQEAMLNREDRVQQLKREVNELCAALGREAMYPSVEADERDPPGG